MDEEALRLGELTKELDPLSPFYSGWLAEQYRDAGMFDEAIEEAEATLRKALELNPALTRAYVALGEIFEKGQRDEEALEMFEEALRWDSSSPEASQGVKRLAAKGRRKGILGG